jgi:hypothetical protein
MGFFKENKKYIGIVALIVLGIWAYMTYFGGEGSATLSSGAQVSPLSQDILATLSNLHTIKLDSTIFSDPLFTSLTDYGVEIPPQNAGRPNPFAPL